MPEFAYNNIKNASIGHTLFKINYGYYPRVSFKEDVDPCSRSRSANKLAEELRGDRNLLSESSLRTKTAEESQWQGSKGP